MSWLGGLGDMPGKHMVICLAHHQHSMCFLYQYILLLCLLMRLPIRLSQHCIT